MRGAFFYLLTITYQLLLTSYYRHWKDCLDKPYPRNIRSNKAGAVGHTLV